MRFGSRFAAVVVVVVVGVGVVVAVVVGGGVCVCVGRVAGVVASLFLCYLRVL